MEVPQRLIFFLPFSRFIWFRRKASQESVKQYSDGSSKNGSSNKYADNGQKYGAWGSVYKNKDNFVNMHLF